MPDLYSGPRPLSEREIQVLTRLAKGMSLTETGAELFISYHTVKDHIGRARRAIGARNKVHLLALAVTTGQLKLEKP